jgi:hypothetical protein
MSQRGQIALAPSQEHCALHGRDDKFRNFIAFELRWQLARLHCCLQALGDRFSNLQKNFVQSAANNLAVLVQLGGHIAVEAAVLGTRDFQEPRVSVDGGNLT